MKSTLRTLALWCLLAATPLFAAVTLDGKGVQVTVEQGRQVLSTVSALVRTPVLGASGSAVHLRTGDS